jgi:diaminohydroxyphosphoribosylaminopyrimidine deaminase/5-amino-6-(5-phosphoribosylamino)uracil reductase
MRAMSDAVLTGIGTALADDPLLTCRLPGMGGCSPVRVVLDAGLRIPLDGRLVATAREVPLWVVSGAAAVPEPARMLANRGAEVLPVAAREGRLELTQVLKLFAERGITRLMVEAGPILSAAFIEADLVDEVALFRSPTAIGPEGIDALEGLPLEALTRSSRLELVGTDTVGADTVELFWRR